MRQLNLTRTEAEMLIELLEAFDPTPAEAWQHDMAMEIRELFGIPPALLSAADREKERQLAESLERAFNSAEKLP